jgi:hypothetical protein
MIENKKVYITFPKGEALSGWIIDFINHFTSTLNRISNNEISYFIKENDFTSDNYKEFVNTSNIFIAILGTSTDDEEEYKEELQNIYQSLDIENKELTELSRIFKVCINPEHQSHPNENLINLQAYNFYEVIKRRQSSIKPFSFKSESNKTWAKLLDLVYDINDTLAISSERNQPENSKFIYLGNSTEDSEITRDDIKRELQHFGFRVLPLTELPKQESQIKDVIEENLKYCNLIVQIISSHYGSIAPGENKSVFEMENIIIREYLKLNNSIQRIIWVPNNLKINDQKQKLFLNRLKRDDADAQTEIIETSQEDFKIVLAQRISGRQQVRSESSDNNCGVYLVTKPDTDTHDIEKLADNLNVHLTKKEGAAEKNYYSKHLENLKLADCVLFYYNDGDENWLKSNLKDAIKAQGLGKDNPFLAIGVITESMPDISDIEPWLPKIFQLKNSDTDSFSEFLSIAKV